MSKKNSTQPHKKAELSASNISANSTASTTAHVILNIGDMHMDSHLQVQLKAISEPLSEAKHAQWHLQRGANGQSGVITMSSREIAELTGKRHTHVMDDSRKLAEFYTETYSAEKSAQLVKPSTYTDSTGREQPCFDLAKQASLDLVTGYSLPHRHAVNVRWQELEAAQAPALPDFSNPVAAARAWADAKESELKAVTALAHVAPKVKFFDTVVDKSALMTATQIAQKLGMSAIQLNKHLDTLGVYAKVVKRARVFKQWVIDKGFGVLKQTEQGYSQPLFTTAGEAWIVAHVTAKGAM